MSAYVVDKELIDVLVDAATSDTQHYRMRYFLDGKYEYIGREHARTVGQLLVDGNVQGVTDRYPDCGGGDLPGPIDAYYTAPYVFMQPQRRTPNQVLDALSEYEYQASDGHNWDDSDARRLCTAIREHMCRKLSQPWKARRNQL